jgi:hypothetical protein
MWTTTTTTTGRGERPPLATASAVLAAAAAAVAGAAVHAALTPPPWLGPAALCPGARPLPPLPGAAAAAAAPPLQQSSLLAAAEAAAAAAWLPDDGACGAHLAAGCTRVPSTPGAGFQQPRFDNGSVPASIGLRWAVWLCPGNGSSSGSAAAAPAAGASGTFVICRRAGCHARDSVPTHDPVAAADLAALGVGPDTFWMELLGPREYHRLVPAHAGACAYTAPYAVVHPGRYGLRLVHLYDRYDGASDVSAHPLPGVWPTVHLDSVLGNTSVVALTPPPVPPSGEPPPPAAPPAGGYDDSGLPECTSPRQIAKGRWLVAASNSSSSSGGGRRRRPPPLATFAPWDYRYAGDALRWAPYGCRWRPLGMAAARACLAGKRVAFRGDSQTRVFFSALLAAVGGVTDAAAKGLLRACVSLNGTHAHLPGAVFCFTFDALGAPGAAWEPPGNATSERRPDHTWFSGAAGASSPSPAATAGYPWDILWLNFGHHPAAIAHWSYRRYRRALEAYFPLVDAGAPPPPAPGGRRRRPLVVWGTPQDAPFPAGAWLARFREHADWRTSPRLRLFAETSARAVARFAAAAPQQRRARYCLVDAHSPSAQSLFLSTDNAHIHHPAYQHLLADLFLRCACDGEA